MRLNDLYDDLLEATTTGDIKPETTGSKAIKRGLPPSFQHSMPGTHAFPDMDNSYGFYRFVVAMAGHPEKTDVDMEMPLRDIPIAVAYTKEEHDMIHNVAARMGITAEELSYDKSSELPDTYTTSPVMIFRMDESRYKRFLDLIQISEAMLFGNDAVDLYEDFQQKKLSPNIEKTLPPIVVVPELNSGNNYPQYRFMTMLAAVKAIEAGEIDYPKLVPWTSSLAVVGYTKEEVEIVKKAAELSGFAVNTMNDSPSEEPDWVQTTSPVAVFNMTESMRNTIDRLGLTEG